MLGTEVVPLKTRRHDTFFPFLTFFTSTATTFTMAPSASAVHAEAPSFPLDDNDLILHKVERYFLQKKYKEALFSINQHSGKLTFITAPDFENPSDENFNGDYIVTVRVTDSNNDSAEQTLIVTVEDVDEDGEW